jgi:hypothetical protein
MNDITHNIISPILLGAHMSIAGGMHTSLERAMSIGCNTMQVFVKSNNQWRGRPLKEDEVEEFKSHFSKFSLIAICSSPEARFQRLFRRRRSDDAKGWDAFHERDIRELSVGVGNAIAMAEYTVVNEEGLDIVKNRIRHVLKKVEGEWKK